MTTELLDEIHPGESLLEDFMKPLGITAQQLAADMDVPPSRISADTALRLDLFFSMDPRYWLNLQTEFDMRTVMRASHDKIAPRIRGVAACGSESGGLMVCRLYRQPLDSSKN